MKKMMMIALGVMVLAITVSVWAADDAADPQKGPGPLPPEEMRQHIRERGMPGMPPRDPNSMRQMMQDSLERRKQEHQAIIKELEDIKKIAESENAAKTAEAIQKLIDSKEAAFKKQAEEVEKRREEMMKRMEQRRKEMGENPQRPRQPQQPKRPE